MKYNKITAIIQARMGSTRLPGKVLRKLEDRTVLGHVITRCLAVPSVSNVIVATSNLEQDDVIADEAAEYGVYCYRGSEHHVLSRFFEAAQVVKTDVVVRVTSDCPLLDPAITEQLIQSFMNGEYDYARIKLTNSFPRGLDSEVFTFKSLKQAYEKAKTEYEREHVTPYIYNNPEQFRIYSMPNLEDHSKYRLTLDTPADWELISRIYQEIYTGSIFGWREVLDLLQKKTEWVKINEEVEQAHSGE
ncbi:cytidylyltransferase domain-containing protein [Neobacillus sp.]|jgi:spore coat polysaccharide biosynthesis protein SpsF|uniref:cytidylyltransferase domain-containing protein n=1 Tax=Neobacillus sp. TaxID=2675273 RepID=UPI0035B4FD63